jgi:hypothetical protein
MPVVVSWEVLQVIHMASRKVAGRDGSGVKGLLLPMAPRPGILGALVVVDSSRMLRKKESEVEERHRWSFISKGEIK